MGREISGVEGVLGALVTESPASSAGKPESRATKRELATKKTNRNVAPIGGKGIAEESPGEPNVHRNRPQARQGRPPGRKRTEPKAKTSLWIAAELMDSYRDWSWEARCNVGELVERALRAYYRRRRRQQKTEFEEKRGH